MTPSPIPPAPTPLVTPLSTPQLPVLVPAPFILSLDTRTPYVRAPFTISAASMSPDQQAMLADKAFLDKEFYQTTLADPTQWLLMLTDSPSCSPGMTSPKDAIPQGWVTLEPPVQHTFSSGGEYYICTKLKPGVYDVPSLQLRHVVVGKALSNVTVEDKFEKAGQAIVGGVAAVAIVGSAATSLPFALQLTQLLSTLQDCEDIPDIAGNEHLANIVFKASLLLGLLVLHGTAVIVVHFATGKPKSNSAALLLFPAAELLVFELCFDGLCISCLRLMMSTEPTEWWMRTIGAFALLALPIQGVVIWALWIKFVFDPATSDKYDEAEYDMATKQESFGHTGGGMLFWDDRESLQEKQTEASLHRTRVRLVYNSIRLSSGQLPKVTYMPNWLAAILPHSFWGHRIGSAITGNVTKPWRHPLVKLYGPMFSDFRLVWFGVLHYLWLFSLCLAMSLPIPCLYRLILAAAADMVWLSLWLWKRPMIGRCHNWLHITLLVLHFVLVLLLIIGRVSGQDAGAVIDEILLYFVLFGIFPLLMLMVL
eukprot:gene3494-3953_t